MASRLQLQTELEDVLGSNNVYFQPPENLQMRYPCIRYNRESSDIKHADNRSYNFTHEYQVILIGYDPDADLVEKMINRFSMLRYSRHYTADGLNHDVFNIYY